MEMTEGRIAATVTDIKTCESIEELDMVEQMVADAGIVDEPAVKEAIAEVRGRLVPETSEEKIARLEARIQQLEQEKTQPKIDRSKVERIGNRYKIVTLDLTRWGTKKPQVHALVKILAREFGVGKEVAESEIIEAVEKHASELRTRQEPKRIWQYYKGDHSDGLTAHGIIEKIL